MFLIQDGLVLILKVMETKKTHSLFLIVGSIKLNLEMGEQLSVITHNYVLEQSFSGVEFVVFYKYF